MTDEIVKQFKLESKSIFLYSTVVGYIEQEKYMLYNITMCYILFLVIIMFLFLAFHKNENWIVRR